MRTLTFSVLVHLVTFYIGQAYLGQVIEKIEVIGSQSVT